MLDSNVVAVVIPCYRVREFICTVINELPSLIDHIVVVDDACPDSSFEKVTPSDRIHVLRRVTNGGVGCALKTGMRHAFEILNVDYVIKIDGDGQMDPGYIKSFLQELSKEEGRVFVKGNRFLNLRELRNMPFIRLFGNSVLTFITKASSGYWHLSDPNNGYLGFSSAIYRLLEVDHLHDRYFFETSVILQLSLHEVPIVEVAMPARYGSETSSLSILGVIPAFLVGNFKGFLRRFFILYILRDFNIGSVSTLLGFPAFFAGLSLSLKLWFQASSSAAPLGTTMIALVLLIFGFQLIFIALLVDIMRSQGLKR